MKFVDEFLDKIIYRIVDEYEINPDGVKNGAIGLAGLTTTAFAYGANWAILTDLDQSKVNAATAAVQAGLSDLAIAPAGAAAYFAAKAITSKDSVSLRRTLLTGFAAAALGTIVTAPVTHNHYESIAKNSHVRGYDQKAP